MTEFKNHPIDNKILEALEENGIITPTEIQQLALPHAIGGKDIFGLAQTGSGKTAAFAIPLLQHIVSKPAKRLPHRPRSLVLAPTRELAQQIQKNLELFGKYLHSKTVVIYGGVSYDRQIRSLKKGVDIVIATPGRLLDLFEKELISFESIEILVLDEVDRMLDMGFIPDIERIQKALPAKKQTMLFSATMPKSIEAISNKFLHQAVKIQAAPANTIAEKIDQSACFVQPRKKTDLLRQLLENRPDEKTLVFTKTKYTTDELCDRLSQSLTNRIESMHGGMSQRARKKALSNFKTDKCHVLIATDVASRGLDVNDIKCVINYDLPDDIESYIHRIGRTARAGKSGEAISLICRQERILFQKLRSLSDITLNTAQPFHCSDTEKACTSKKRQQSKESSRPWHKPKKPSSSKPFFKKKSKHHGKKTLQLTTS